MSRQERPLEEKAAELKRAFDRSFAEAPATERPSLEDFLAIRVGPDPYAVPLAAISGLYADRTVTRLPSPVTESLGIAGFRGSIVAVYDLRVILGYPTGETPRWLMVAAETPVGLAFDGFEAYLRFPLRAKAQAGRVEQSHPYLQGVLRTADAVRPVVQLGPILEALKRRVQAAARQEQRP